MYLLKHSNLVKISVLSNWLKFVSSIHIFGPVEQLATFLQNPKHYASDLIKASDALKKKHLIIQI